MKKFLLKIINSFDSEEILGFGSFILMISLFIYYFIYVIVNKQNTNINVALICTGGVAILGVISCNYIEERDYDYPAELMTYSRF